MLAPEKMVLAILNDSDAGLRLWVQRELNCPERGGQGG
jgi:hypothetical protein